MANPFATILEGAVNSNKFLGVSFIAVDKKGQAIYSGAHGKRSFSQDEPLRLDTTGFMASMSKLVTSVAAMQVIERGLVCLDDDLGKILSELGDREILVTFDEETKQGTFEKPTEKITLRRLLTHSSGFTYDNMHPTLQKWVIANGKEREFFSGEFHGSAPYYSTPAPAGSTAPVSTGPAKSWKPDIPKEVPLDHGLGGLLVMEGVPARRRKGAMCWAGMTNSQWMLDRETGVSCMLFVQILPAVDPATKQLWTKLEKEVYKYIAAK